jgi:hypothetical protein
LISCREHYHTFFPSLRKYYVATYINIQYTSSYKSLRFLCCHCQWRVNNPIITFFIVIDNHFVPFFWGLGDIFAISYTSLVFQGVSAVKAFYELLCQSSLSTLHPEENKPVAPVELCPILKMLYKILITRCSTLSLSVSRVRAGAHVINICAFGSL